MTTYTLDKNCENYGSSWCADFYEDCPGGCPMHKAVSKLDPAPRFDEVYRKAVERMDAAD